MKPREEPSGDRSDVGVLAKKARPTYTHIAWWLLPLGLFIGVTIFLFGDRNTAGDEVIAVTPLSGDMELVTVDKRASGSVPSTNLLREFIPPHEHLVERLSQNLRLFRADFRPAAPSVTVSAKPGSTDRERVASELGRMLARTETGQLGEAKLQSPDYPEINPGIILYAKQANREIVHRFIREISPYFNGTVLIVFREERRLDRMLMVINGVPAFEPNGSVVFTNN